MSYLMAIDPGGTTGLAFRYPKGGGIETTTVDTQEALWAYFKLYEIPLPDTVICEEWQYFTGKTTPAGIYTAHLVSSLTGICHVLGIPFALKTPTSRFAKLQDATDWYKKARNKKRTNKMDSHEIDALAHLLTWEAAHGANN